VTGFVRTPEERFVALPGFDFAPNWLEWDGLRLHYLDEGSGPLVVLFHGEPTWSFLYRKVIPRITAAGFRAIAPDYPGFGKSDKPTDPAFYTYDRLTAAMRALVDHLDLREAAAVVQDWGGPIGLRVAVEAQGRFTRLSILNTGLFTGGRSSDAFLAWRRFAEQHPDLPIGRVVSTAAATHWPDEVVAGYEAPFPDQDHKVGAWRLPLIVPIHATDAGAAEMQAVAAALGGWARPVQVLFGDSDPMFTLRVAEQFARSIPGAGDVEVIEGAGHFLQEDKGEEVGASIVEFLRRSG